MNWTAHAVELQDEGRRRAHILVSAHEEERGPRPPLLLNLVLDRSGSMTGAPLAAAVEAAQQIVAQCQKDDFVGLVVFDGVVEQRVPVIPVDEVGRYRLTEALREIRPGSGTHLHQAVRVGTSALARLVVPGRKGRVVLLTDGEPSVGPQSEAAFAALGQEIAQSGVSLHPIGLGAHYVPDILTALARPSGTAYGHADGPDGLSLVMGGVFALLLGASSVESAVHLLPRQMRLIELRHRYPSTQEGGGLWVKLQGVGQGQVRRVLFSGEPEAPTWSAEVFGVTQDHKAQEKDPVKVPVDVQRAWPDSAEGRVVRSVGHELDLLEAETQAWTLLLARDGRAQGFLEQAEHHLRQLVALDVKDIPRRRHLERLGDLRLAVERGEGDLQLLSRRARSAQENTSVSQVIPLPVPRLRTGGR